MSLPAAQSEFEALAELKKIAAENKVFRSFIGQGYYDCITPPVIQRNVLENPGWYTQYTPYQAEISQGRLEALLNFQTMVSEITALDIANASMLDEATAAAEAMTMSHRLKDGRNIFFVSENCHPQTIEVVRSRAEALKIEIVIGDHETFSFSDKVFGALVQYPDTFGAIHDYSGFAEKAHAAGAMLTSATDLLALTLIKPPGEFGADIAVGSAQRFGVPLGYGGPHAAFFATRDEFKRQMPGRIVGVSKDSRGKPALRLALGTREQHIRREKATSNICTAQALLANMASLYACYHGAEGLKAIARRVYALTKILAAGLAKLGHKVSAQNYFDTLCVDVAGNSLADILKIAEAHRMNLRAIDEKTIGISLDETTSANDVAEIWQIFNGDKPVDFDVNEFPPAQFANYAIAQFAISPTPRFQPLPQRDRNAPLPQAARIARPVAHGFDDPARFLHDEAERGGGNVSSVVAGVCEDSSVRAAGQTRGYQILFQNLEDWLAEITGFAGISLQPNAGSQGEYAGLLVIRAYHESRGEAHRNVCLIPTSAHGTNPASAVMAGMKVVAVACDANGNIDVADLKSKAEAHRKDLSCLMITYPSTHGVFEETIRDISEIIHTNGGQVYMDGANMNAQVGLTSPGFIGADVCHLNLHKTFCIPHGGGGPGVGPIGVAKHLVHFLPSHPVFTSRLETKSFQATHRPGERRAVGQRGHSSDFVDVYRHDGRGRSDRGDEIRHSQRELYFQAAGKLFPDALQNGLVAHECILDLRAFHSTTAEDVAKRLMDYGFHAPTLSWPVAGTLMVEPTESESKYELDRFCDAMISIHAEMTAVENGSADAKNNLLKNAPHTADQIASDAWNRPYSREQAAFPAKSLHDYKFWPHVSRVDNVFGDRNPVCSCAGMENYS